MTNKKRRGNKNNWANREIAKNIYKAKHAGVEKNNKERDKKNNKRTKRMVEKGRRKKNDGEPTVTRRSRLLSRHSARLSRECSVIARDRAQDRYRAEPRASYQRRRCYRCDRWTEVHATTRHDMKCARSLSLPPHSVSLSFTLSLFLSFTRYFALPLSLFLRLSISYLSSRVSQSWNYAIALN